MLAGTGVHRDGVVPANFGVVPQTLYCGLESFLPPLPRPSFSGVVVPSRAFKPAHWGSTSSSASD